MSPTIAGALAFVIGYTLGSIPFGIVLTRLTGGPDLRTVGSGNIGATNVLRTGKKWVAVCTLLGDMFKGTVAVLLAHWLLGPIAALVAGFAAFVGHLFPVWLKFKGGKGVATYIGILLGLAWPFALLFGVVWLGVAWLSRYSSLAAIIASAAVLAALWLGGYQDIAMLMSVLTLLLIFMHRANIRRLLDGSEGKIKLRSS
jgi:acyl phosphate:glycerol-3-phosphate acyltransferase